MKKEINIENLLYFLAFGIALFIRLIRLGVVPLNDAEASLALQAFNIANGKAILVGAHPLYTLITSGIFFLFGSGNLGARLVPALGGSFLIFSPILFNKWIGKKPSLLLAFIFAIEPSLVAISRQADSLILAVTFLIITIGFFLKRTPLMTGILAGLAVLSGPGVWYGVILLGVVIGWNYLISRSAKTGETEERDASIEENEEAWNWKTFLSGFLLVLLFIGTMFFLIPSGLSAAVSAIAAYFTGWAQGSGTSILQVVAALLAFEIISVILGVIEVILGFREGDRVNKFLFRWVTVALIILILYPARQTTDLVWVSIPLWVLVARFMIRKSELFEDDRLPLLGYSLLVFVLFVFIGLNLKAFFFNTPSGIPDAQLRLVGIIAGCILLAIVTFLVGWGWSVGIVANGLKMAVGLILLAFTLSAGVHAAEVGRNPQAELLLNSPAVRDADIMIKTIGNFSEWTIGQRTDLDISVVNEPYPSLQWALRNFIGTKFVTGLSPDTQSSLLITSEKEAVSLATTYTGQDFVWEEAPAWSLMSPTEWAKWFYFRDAPLESYRLILWARSDLFPGQSSLTQQTP